MKNDALTRMFALLFLLFSLNCAEAQGGAQHVVLEQCAVQIDEMQGAAERRAPEAADPAAGRRCRATQQIGYLHKQCSALHVKDHPSQSGLNAAVHDPSFQEHPYLDREMRKRIIPYLMPLDHPAKATLDWIFSQSRVLENEKSLLDADFNVIAGPMPFSFAIVAKHPSIPGYVFKLYLDSETRCRKKIPNWVWLTQRCAGARGIKKVIKRNHIRLFTVPDKWLYVVPAYPGPSSLKSQHVILVATDMEPENLEVSKQMWKTEITRKHLDELYLILKSGYGGHGVLGLPNNVPYTKQGKFAFTDTEDPRTKFKLEKHVKQFVSKEMQNYWDRLVNEE